MSNPAERNGLLIVFQPEGRRGVFPKGITILAAAKDLGIDLASICGGMGLCGKCKVVIRSGGELLNPLTSSEMKCLEPGEIKAGFRLACQARGVSGGRIVVEVPEQSRSGKQRLLVEGRPVEVELEPAVRELVIEVSKPTLEDPLADFERLLKSTGLSELDQVDLQVLRELPAALREGGWSVAVIVHTKRGILMVRPARSSRGLYGFAVDIGTTKLAGYLIDLRTGKMLSVASSPNPQIPYGEDVISRIAYASRSDENLEELHRVIVEGVNKLIEDACRSAGVDASEIVELVAVGNTLMHHLFLGLPPKYLAASPYPPVVRRALDFRASDLGVRILPSGNVHMLPNVAGFVGADAVADVLATGIHRSRELCFVIDVGTNTEIVVGNMSGMYSASCASGPAFEGAHIKFGMRATSGAIERVWIDPSDLSVQYQVIDDVKPKGICGSGIVDALAEMLNAGVVDTMGRIVTRESQRVREGSDGPEFVIAFKEETAIGKDIVITQRDVRELQKAKAAMYTGASIVMKEAGVGVRQIKKVYIAGAFGLYIDPSSARRIGMIPPFPLHIISQVGNAAGTGAKIALTSLRKRLECGEIVSKMRYIELAAHPDFQQEFLAAMYLPHLELDRFGDMVEKMDNLTVSNKHKALLERLMRRENRKPKCDDQTCGSPIKNG